MMSRTEGRFRVYAESEVARLKTVLLLKDLGMSLEEIASLIKLWHNGPVASRSRRNETPSDPRIEPSVRQVDGEVRHHEHERKEEHRPLDRREVTLEDRLQTFVEAYGVLSSNGDPMVKLQVDDSVPGQRFIDVMNCLAGISASRSVRRNGVVSIADMVQGMMIGRRDVVNVVANGAPITPSVACKSG